jgi:hypothetical protein
MEVEGKDIVADGRAMIGKGDLIESRLGGERRKLHDTFCV